MGIAVFATTYLQVNWMNVGISVVTGAIVYVLSLQLIFKIQLVKEVKTFLKYE